MDGFKIAGSPGLSGIFQGNDSIKDYLSLFNNSFVGIFRCRFSDGTFFLINQGALNILGIAAVATGSLYNWVAKDLFTGKATGSYGETTRTELEYGPPGGERKWIAITWMRHPETDFLVGMITDITEQKKLETTLKVMQEEMDTFIYHASHQLKSPITTILGATYLLKLDSADEQMIHTYCDMVEVQVRRLNDLFKELMHVFANHQSDIGQELIDFHVLLDDVLAELLPLYPGVRVNTDVADVHNFYSDNKRLTLILKNLLSNALKFRDPAKEAPEVHVKIAASPADVIISVKDNGISIEEHTLKNDLYKIFFKGAEQSKHGFGLGLYLVKNIVDKMRGSITARSASGRGSEFIVKIPDATRYARP